MGALVVESDRDEIYSVARGRESFCRPPDAIQLRGVERIERILVPASPDLHSDPFAGELDDQIDLSIGHNDVSLEHPRPISTEVRGGQKLAANTGLASRIIHATGLPDECDRSRSHRTARFCGAARDQRALSYRSPNLSNGHITMIA